MGKLVLTIIWAAVIAVFLFTVADVKAESRIATCTHGSDILEVVYNFKAIGVPKDRVWEEFEGLGGGRQYKAAIQEAVDIVYPYELPFSVIKQIFLEHCLDFSKNKANKKGVEM